MRLSEQDMAEFRLRVAVGGRGDVPRLRTPDVEALLDEVEACWDGKLPDWAASDERCEYDDGDTPRPYVVSRIEAMADAAMNISSALADKFPNGSATWKTVAEDLFKLLEDIEDDKACAT